MFILSFVQELLSTAFPLWRSRCWTYTGCISLWQRREAWWKSSTRRSGGRSPKVSTSPHPLPAQPSLSAPSRCLSLIFHNRGAQKGVALTDNWRNDIDYVTVWGFKSLYKYETKDSGGGSKIFNWCTVITVTIIMTIKWNILQFFSIFTPWSNGDITVLHELLSFSFRPY